jgi:hypothetical protein
VNQRSFLGYSSSCTPLCTKSYASSQVLLKTCINVSELLSYYSFNILLTLIVKYFSNKHVERDLHQRCVEEFELAALQKDDNITPDLMIECCDRLLRHKSVLSPSLKGVHLWVTNYYSVLSDGEMCVPWNWKL